MARTERTPEARKIDFPVFVPSPNGETSLEVAIANLRAGTLVIEFNNRLPGVAIQRMIERGSLLGLSFVMLQADDANVAAQERLAQEEKQEEFNTLMESVDEVFGNETNEGDN